MPSSSHPPTPYPPSTTTTSSTTTPTLHSYHCLCSTHLLTTPYALSSLPQRRPPSIDQARILPLPSFPPSASEAHDQHQGYRRDRLLPSLVSPNLKVTRKPWAVQREDGWEKRRMWRCGRCGLGVGYEVLGHEDRGDGGRGGDGEEGSAGKVLFLLDGGLDGGLVETGDWEG